MSIVHEQLNQEVFVELWLIRGVRTWKQIDDYS